MATAATVRCRHSPTQRDCPRRSPARRFSARAARPRARETPETSSAPPRFCYPWLSGSPSRSSQVIQPPPRPLPACLYCCGLGTKKSKVVLFVFESESMKAVVDQLWPAMIPLGDVNKKLIRGLTGSEMARFKFRKGCLTIYVYAVRWLGAAGFMRTDDLRRILQSVVDLKDFLDHTTMLAIPSQKSITLQSRTAAAVAH